MIIRPPRPRRALRGATRRRRRAAGPPRGRCWIERELTRIQSEIETQQASLERLDSQIALSELSVRLERRQILGPPGYVVYGVWWGISKLFVIR